jgi:hypothetical protein
MIDPTPRGRSVLIRACIWSMFLLLMAVLPAEAQQEVRFGVLGLFHPHELQLEPVDGAVLSVVAKDATGTSSLVLNGEPDHRQLLFRAEEGRVAVGSRSAALWIATARNGGPVAFRLTVPGRFHRVYLARLTIEARNGKLVVTAAMDRETAVASIVASEMDETAPIEALKAQAVATRSFLAAGQRHLDFDFCDTTHCQFLKGPPVLTSRIYSAVHATQGLMIMYRGKPLAAMYSSRCGGHTRTLRDVGMEPGEGYPYFSVSCAWCLKHRFTWRSKIGNNGHALRSDNERQRIAGARQWGWSAIPGSDFTATRESSSWRLEGHSVGHGVGMCQHGAIGMATLGASFLDILSSYYPNTDVAP